MKIPPPLRKNSRLDGAEILVIPPVETQLIPAFDKRHCLSERGFHTIRSMQQLILIEIKKIPSWKLLLFMETVICLVANGSGGKGYGNDSNNHLGVIGHLLGVGFNGVDWGRWKVCVGVSVWCICGSEIRVSSSFHSGCFGSTYSKIAA